MTGRAAAPWERAPGAIAPWLLRAVRDRVDAGESDVTVAMKLGVDRNVVRQARDALAAEHDGGEAA